MRVQPTDITRPKNSASPDVIINSWAGSGKIALRCGSAKQSGYERRSGNQMTGGSEREREIVSSP